MQWLAKAQMQRLRADGTLDGSPLDVAFNPTEYTLNKAAQLAEIAIPGLDSPMLQYVHGQTETLNMELFFDSTDEGGTGEDAKSVTELTDPFYQLIRIDPATRALPVILFTWGGDAFPGGRSYQTLGPSRHGFKGVLESVRQRFTMFSSLGKPLRATIAISMKEYKTLAELVAEQSAESSDRPAAQVLEEGQALTDVTDGQGNSDAWRGMADANGIDDPEAVEPGTVLETGGAR